MIYKRNHIYRYKELGETPLCIYMCDTQIRDRILIMPLTELPSSNTFKLSVTKQYAALDKFKEINISDIISPLYLNSQPVKISEQDVAFLQQDIIKCILERVSLEACSHNASLSLFESIYQFLQWMHHKFLLNTTAYQRKTQVYENALYWSTLGVNVGSELNKNRPVLIWKKRCSGKDESNFSYIVIPITSKDKSKKYYMNVPIDIDGRPCYLRIEDMKRINIKRITRPITDGQNKIIFIDNDKRKEIIEAIQRFYIFNNTHTSS